MPEETARLDHDFAKLTEEMSPMASMDETMGSDVSSGLLLDGFLLGGEDVEMQDPMEGMTMYCDSER